MHRRERWLLYLLLSRYAPLQPKEWWRPSVAFQIESLISSTWPRYELYVERCEPRYLSLTCEITSPFLFFPSAPRSPKTDLHHPLPQKAGPCPRWFPRRPPRPPRARRRLLLAPRPDPNEPRRRPGSSPRRSPRSWKRARNPSSPPAPRRKRVNRQFINIYNSKNKI